LERFVDDESWFERGFWFWFGDVSVVLIWMLLLIERMNLVLWLLMKFFSPSTDFASLFIEKLDCSVNRIKWCPALFAEK
jgi:hypothetical protein